MIGRIHSLQPDFRAIWGKIDVARMLAHLCVPYEMAYEGKHRRPSPLRQFWGVTRGDGWHPCGESC